MTTTEAPAEAYPLCWPAGFPRTPSSARVWGQIKVGMPDAIDHLRDNVRQLGGRHLIVSTNVPVRRDGDPYASSEPTDPGVAIYFDWKGAPRSMACDRYDKVRKNVRALGLTIEAMRALERHGSSEILERAFRGFAALPATASGPGWWDVLGCDRSAGVDDVRAAYRARAMETHPDKPGGSESAFAAVQVALDSALSEKGAV